jgi:hypothetical protein
MKRLLRALGLISPEDFRALSQLVHDIAAADLEDIRRRHAQTVGETPVGVPYALRRGPAFERKEQ